MPEIRRMAHRWMGGLSLTAALVAPVPAQGTTEIRLAPVAAMARSRADADTLSPRRTEIDYATGVVGGIAGGALGGLAGLGVGVLVVENRGCVGDFCGLPEALLGMIVGESIGLAVGSHYGSRGRASLTGVVLASVGVGVAGTVLGAYAGGWPILLVPFAQLATVLALEHP